MKLKRLWLDSRYIIWHRAPMDKKELHAYFSALGQGGGRANSEAQRKARAANIAKANEARAKAIRASK